MTLTDAAQALIEWDESIDIDGYDLAAMDVLPGLIENLRQSLLAQKAEEPTNARKRTPQWYDPSEEAD